VSNLMKREEIKPRAKATYRLLGVGAVIATWALTAVLICVQILSRRAPDLRLAPFASDSHFFSDLQSDDAESFKMVCFPYDAEEPPSCSIALRYQDALGKYWTPEDIVFDQDRAATFKGISILTQSTNAPKGALRLRQQFRTVGIETDFRTADPSSLKLGPKDFAVWIGGKP
jgi:hypothetical protein